MIDVVKRVIVNVLIALYEPFGFAIILAVLFMGIYMFVGEYGWKEIFRRWKDMFKTSSSFRRTFFLAFYIALVLFKTLLNRNIYGNPLSNVLGVWGLYNEEGQLMTDLVENIILFIPCIIVLLWNFSSKILGERVCFVNVLWKSSKIIFLFSFVIEFLQLFLCLGTFQLSDLFFNTLGGLIGGVIYWCGYKATHRNKKEKKDNIS